MWARAACYARRVRPAQTPPSAARAALALAAVATGALLACSTAALPPPDDLDAPPPRTPSNPQPRDPPELASADASAPGEDTCETVPPNHRCGLAPQCGCAKAETCDVTTESTGATSCVTGGTATLGRPCGATGDCMPGLTCVFGACRPFCKTPRTRCTAPGTELCVEVTGDDDMPMPNLAVCTIACDPREPQAVCGTNACVWFSDYYTPSRVSDCNRPGTTKPLEACSSMFECTAGHTCAEHPTYGKECARWCRLGHAGDCPAGFSCNDVFGEKAPTSGGVREGVCQDD
jgi:hypothetical protein